MVRTFSILCLLALLRGAAAEETATTPPEATKEAIFTGHSLPREVTVGVMLSQSTLVHSVYGATQLSGGAGGKPVTTGTLAPSGMGQYRYSPEPRDKLVVRIGTETHEFVVKHVEGNTRAAYPTDFLAEGHVLEYSHTIPGKMKANVKIAYKGGKVSMDIVGSHTLKGREFAVDLHGKGEVKSTADLVGTTTVTTYDVTGTVRCDPLKMLLTVKESHVISEMLSKQRIPSRFQPVGLGKRMAKTLTVLTDVINSTLKLGEDNYRWVDCRTRKGLYANEMTSWPGDFHDWLASGKVEKNGAPYGRYDVVREGAGPDPNVCRIVLKTVEGPMDVEVIRR